ncbi:hypothetical protein ARTHROSP310_11430 [Arthrobacter sp. AD-310]
MADDIQGRQGDGTAVNHTARDMLPVPRGEMWHIRDPDHPQPSGQRGSYTTRNRVVAGSVDHHGIRVRQGIDTPGHPQDGAVEDPAFQVAAGNPGPLKGAGVRNSPHGRED